MRLGYVWRRIFPRSGGRSGSVPQRRVPEGEYLLDDTTEIPMGEVVILGPRAAKAQGASRSA